MLKSYNGVSENMDNWTYLFVISKWSNSCIFLFLCQFFFCNDSTVSWMLTRTLLKKTKGFRSWNPWQEIILKFQLNVSAIRNRISHKSHGHINNKRWNKNHFSYIVCDTNSVREYPMNALVANDKRNVDSEITRKINCDQPQNKIALNIHSIDTATRKYNASWPLQINDVPQ